MIAQHPATAIRANVTAALANMAGGPCYLKALHITHNTGQGGIGKYYSLHDGPTAAGEEVGRWLFVGTADDRSELLLEFGGAGIWLPNGLSFDTDVGENDFSLLAMFVRA